MRFGGWRDPRRWRMGVVATVGVVAACNLSQRAMRWSFPGAPGAMREVVAVGTLDAEIPESSGLTPSGRQPGVYWTHNDSDNPAVLHAVDGAGRTVARVRLPELPEADWEAVGGGPCPAGHCLVVGDVGDNLARRTSVRLLRLPEPPVADAPMAAADTAGDTESGAASSADRVEVLAVRYPDGARDVEALYVAPDTSVWLVTKRPIWWALRGRPARLYRVPASAWGAARVGGKASEGVVAEFAGTLPVVPGRWNAREWITDAALSPVRPDGARRLAVLTYGTVHVFAADPLTGRPGARLGRCPLPIAEHDPEAVAWREDGALLVTNEGRRSTVYAGRCP
ncbi:MAG: hypothetical protein KJT01_06365 [Gemmatimonadetes bacterium]|nr:hypothetical protein [Gemmatimonadota bacterium]